jgi:Ca-activated chloride channel homolog
MIRTTKILEEAALANQPLVDEDAGFGILRSERGCLPLVAMDVRAQLAGLAAETTVKQTFRNTLDEPLEATYIFPLPDRAAVTSFRMKVADRIIEGELKERAQAREDYEKAIESGHRAAIAEEERSGTFSLRVGNIPAKEQISVELTLVGPLAVCNGEATFRFPLVVAPRYISGVPLDGAPVGSGWGLDTNEVPDASRITPPVLLPGFPNPVCLSLEVILDPMGLSPKTTDGTQLIHSSLHSVILEECPPWTIRLQPGERLNRDFILRFPVANESIQAALLCSPVAASQPNVFALTLVPPALNENHRPAPRDVVVVLDRSGSMGGWKMVAARRAVGRMIDTLLEQDRFTLLAFDNAIEFPHDTQGQLIAASNRHRWQALEWLGKIDARGGTEMGPALQKAVELLAKVDAARQRIVVLITDGQIGGEDAVLRTLQQSSGASMPRIHTLGIDRAVNEGFLKRLAELGGGTCDIVESEDRLDEVMDQVHRGIGQPALSELRLEPLGFELAADSLSPIRLPDLFADRPVTVFGRCPGNHASIRFRVHGLDSNGHAWHHDVEAFPKPVSSVLSLWGRAKVRELEDRYAAGGMHDPEALARQIVEVSLASHVLSRFTAYVAVDHSEVVNAGGKQSKITQPVEMPAGWDMLMGMAPDSTVLCCMAAMPDEHAPRRRLLKRGIRASAMEALEDRKLLFSSRKRTEIIEDVRDLLEKMQQFEKMSVQALTRTLRRLVVFLTELAADLKAEKHAVTTEVEKLVKYGQEIVDDTTAGRQGALGNARLKDFFNEIMLVLDPFDNAPDRTTKRKSFWK